jgi:hypothetical protein
VIASMLEAKEMHAEFNSVPESHSEEINLNPVMPLNFLKLDGPITISELISNATYFEEKALFTGISCNYNETNDTFLSDLVRYTLFYYLIKGKTFLLNFFK